MCHVSECMFIGPFPSTRRGADHIETTSSNTFSTVACTYIGHCLEIGLHITILFLFCIRSESVHGDRDERSQSISPFPSIWYTRLQFVPSARLDIDAEQGSAEGEGKINAIVLKKTHPEKTHVRSKCG
jgi:hypothetical protein